MRTVPLRSSCVPIPALLRPRSLRARRSVSRAVLVAGALFLGGGACAPGTEHGGEAAPPACETPVRWRIGFVDARFGLHGSEVRRAAEEAAALWESAVGRQLFAHDPHGGLSIELEYDDRQRQLEEKAKIEQELRRWQAELARTPRSRFEVERYNRLVDRYNAALEAYLQRPPLQFQVGEYSHTMESPSRRLKNRRIRVWAVESRQGLTSTLAHEFGHALGLGHVADSTSLMTARGEAPGSAGIVLGEADLEEFRRVCGTGG